MKFNMPIFASDRLAAKLFDMTRSDFIRLVDEGHLPCPKLIGNHKRWDVQELQRIASGEQMEEIGGIKW